jgi:type IV secretory pathway VirD2 relaxase
MRQMEQDLETRLDWIAVDHHNTGHPHTHIIVRGVTDDGKILNIMGDYIAHGIRHRASELVTRELGHQSELELVRKLASEVDADRLTRLDRILIAERQDTGIVDLRPGEGQSYLVRENRYVLIDRAKRLERFGLTLETEPGRWFVSECRDHGLSLEGSSGTESPDDQPGAHLSENHETFEPLSRSARLGGIRSVLQMKRAPPTGHALQSISGYV